MRSYWQKFSQEFTKGWFGVGNLAIVLTVFIPTIQVVGDFGDFVMSIHAAEKVSLVH
jgi:hypothetical protein